ncbi:Monocarboxylate transporter 12, partial [Pseudolycoriella hygida]
MVLSSKRFKKVPPEGGWGFLVLFGLAIFLTFSLGTFPSLALIFGDFLAERDEDSGALTTLMSWYFASFSCVGLVTNYFFKLFTVRSVALVGAVVFMVGSVWAVFATTFADLVLAFGVLEGAGFGLMISASYLTFNAYFVKKRIMMMSVAQSIFGLGTMAYPIFVQFFMEEFGYRGFMAIRAGFHGHVLFGMLLMHPVEWHMKKVICEELLFNDRVNDTETKYEDNQNRPFELINDDSKTRGKVDIQPMKHVSIKNLWTKVVDFLDLTLMKDPIYVNISLGISFALYSDMSFFAIQPLYLLKLNLSKTIIAHIIAIGATADLISRIFLAVSSTWIRLKARDIYLIGAALTIIARFAFLYVNDFIGIVTITAAMGFLRTWIHVPLPIVFGDHLPPTRFPSGYGLFMFIQGMSMFALTSVVTKISSMVQDDIVTFHILTLAMALCVMPWILEKIWLKLKKK